LFTSIEDNKDDFSKGWSKFGASGINDTSFNNNLDDKQQLNNNNPQEENIEKSNIKDKHEKEDNYQYNMPLESVEMLTKLLLYI